jgi:hypothetical protein
VRDQGAASSRGCVNDPNHWLAAPPGLGAQLIAADVILCSLLKTAAERAGDRN